MKTKFTTGPWGILTSESGAKAVFSGETGNWIATTCGKAWKTEDEANARLIAAAPEMYEALAAIEAVLRGNKLANVGNSTIHYALCLAKNATAKATGEQS